jgi:hypothetical protein
MAYRGVGSVEKEKVRKGREKWAVWELWAQEGFGGFENLF